MVISILPMQPFLLQASSNTKLHVHVRTVYIVYLAVILIWRFFVRPPNLNDANIASLLLYL